MVWHIRYDINSNADLTRLKVFRFTLQYNPFKFVEDFAKPQICKLDDDKSADVLYIHIMVEGQRRRIKYATNARGSCEPTKGAAAGCVAVRRDGGDSWTWTRRCGENARSEGQRAPAASETSLCGGPIVAPEMKCATSAAREPEKHCSAPLQSQGWWLKKIRENSKPIPMRNDFTDALTS
ncbi:hypothetical protein K1T71_011115 [Dendrolimus kikuchii]|uniref:Uncharacterized protein n=1 Tax=Dendrolimus kikuchii TaxID=765133 RepID=A0ACC1CMU2_9NEOP|nr:hypothetical protein K1T71_011115 [Dendrolimus kikuchii]